MLTFELLGETADETRLLRAPKAGYSIALTGHPRMTAVPYEVPRYDCVVSLGDIAATHGFRIDDLPTTVDPVMLAKTLATVYASHRAVETPKLSAIPARMRPASSTAGAQATYRLRDSAEPTMEQLSVILHVSPTGMWALYHTVWFHNADVNVIEWAHLRASFGDQHAWDPARPRDTAPTIWPPSRIAVPSAKLNLTDTEWGEAAAKAAELEGLRDEQAVAILDVLLKYVRSDASPRAEVHELTVDDLCADMRQYAPSEAASVLLRNVRNCRTLHDLRGWAWECAWALENRGTKSTAEPDRR